MHIQPSGKHVSPPFTYESYLSLNELRRRKPWIEFPSSCNEAAPPLTLPIHFLCSRSSDRTSPPKVKLSGALGSFQETRLGTSRHAPRYRGGVLESGELRSGLEPLSSSHSGAAVAQQRRQRRTGRLIDGMCEWVQKVNDVSSGQGELADCLW